MVALSSTNPATLQRQLLRYLQVSVSQATTDATRQRALRVRQRVVQRSVRRLLALQRGVASWYDVLLTVEEASVCTCLALAVDEGVREKLLAWLAGERAATAEQCHDL